MLFSKTKFVSRDHVSGQPIGLLLLATLSGLLLSQPAFASNITVGAPVNGTSVSSPVWVRAHNVGCDGLAPTAFGFSIDNSGTLTRGVTAFDIDTKAAISAGTHTIHYKAWTTNGACPVVSTTFKVAGGSTASGSTSGGTTSSSTGSASYSLPSNAIPSANLDGIGGWSGEHDAGTPGSSRGSMAYPASVPSYGDARKFYMTYSDHGGERWHVSFGKNETATHFVLDTYIFIINPSQVANLETRSEPGIVEWPDSDLRNPMFEVFGDLGIYRDAFTPLAVFWYSLQSVALGRKYLASHTGRLPSQWWSCDSRLGEFRWNTPCLYELHA